ncbi:hypothetical protein CTA2_12590 [Colletotrichum tanaceti]|nr:hypothetical protein CTA2_12590 [Colletotrichum tanaceti]
MDGLNMYRTVRVGEVLSDFRTLQYYIAAAPTDPINMEDYYTEGWAALRQCSLDGQHILDCAADTSVPTVGGGPLEQEKAELNQCMLDSFARRHECQKIYLRQAAAQRWIGNRDGVLQGGRPNSRNGSHLRACDQQLRVVSLSAPPNRTEPKKRGGAYPDTSLTRMRCVTGALDDHRRGDLQPAAGVRPLDGPLDGRGPEPAKRAALAPRATTFGVMVTGLT